MTKKTKQKTIIFSSVVMGLFAVYLLAPFVSAQVENFQEGRVIYDGPKLRLDGKVEIPNIIVGTTTVRDFSQIDLDQEVELSPGVSVRLRSKAALDAFDIPKDLRQLIQDYDADRRALDAKILSLPGAKEKEKEKLDRAFRYIAQKKLIEKGLLPHDYFTHERRKDIYTEENIVDVRNGSFIRETLNGIGAGGTIETHVQATSSKEIMPVSQQTFFDRVKAYLASLGERIIAYVELAVVRAQGTTPADMAIQYLLGTQNADGSWGSATTTRFIATARVLDTLQVAEMGTSTAATTSASWLNFYIADNNDYLARKTTLLARAGEDVADLTDFLVSNLDEGTGGFSFDRGFEPDPQTTAHVLRALTASGYEDPGNNPNLTVSAALYYLVNTQRFDGGWSGTTEGSTSLLATADVVRALLPYRTATLSGFEEDDIPLSPIVNTALNALKAKQKTNGSWEDNILTTSAVFAALKEGSANPLYQEEALSYLEAAQAGNGSFSNGNIYVTAEAARALILGKSGAESIVVTDIAPLSTTQTGATTTIRISFTNEGLLPVSTGTLQLFADNLHIGSYDLSGLGITVDPSEPETLDITLSNTWRFVGDVSFTLFFEGAGEIIHSNSWYAETVTFAPDNSAYAYPGLPVYFIAHKHTISGFPALNVRWQQKNDPNRLRYEIMWKEQGASSWNSYPIDNSWNGAFLWGGFTEGVTYEITVGATAADGNHFTYFENPVLVKMSVNSGSYTGSISGSVFDTGAALGSVPLFGYGISATTSSNGTFSKAQLPNGSSALWVDKIQYEKFVTTFLIPNGGSTQNIKVHTRIKPDTSPPSSVYLTLLGGGGGNIYNKRSYSIYATSSDNVGIESAIFYYYNPGDASWHVIGSDTSQTYWEVSKEWFIPAELLGAGFQAKVVVRDFMGNTAEGTFGPFEIIEGNALPEFKFIEPNGTDDVANTSFVIKWTDEDPEENAIIRFSYDTDQDANNGGLVSIVNNLTEDDPLDQFVWNTGTSTVPDGQYYIYATIDDDINGAVSQYSQYPVVVDRVGIASSAALIFDRNNDRYLRIADTDQNALDVTGSLTIEAWVKVRAFRETSGERLTILSRRDGNNGYWFNIRNVQGSQNMELIIENGGVRDIFLAPFIFPTDVWKHISVVWDASTKTAKFYVNGEQAGVAQTGINASIGDPNSTFYLGAEKTGGSDVMDGIMDDVRVWNIARSQNDIIADYSRQLRGDENGLVGYWKFNDTVKDSTSLTNHLEEVNHPVYTADVPFGGTLMAGTNSHSVFLDRSENQHLVISDSSQANLDINSNFTFEGWVKLNSLASGYGSEMTIISKWDEANGNNAAYRFAIDTVNKLEFVYKDNANNVTAAVTNDPVMTNTGTWRHLAVTGNIAVPTVSFYVDGVLAPSSMTQSQATGIKNSSADFTIGSRMNSGISGGASDHLDGVIDDIRIWSTIRSQNDLLTYRLKELSGGEGGLVSYWKLNDASTDDISGNTLIRINSPAYATNTPFIGVVNNPPSITINEPNGVGDSTNTSYPITWLANDSEGDASISLFYDSNSSGTDGILIAENLAGTTTVYTWNTTAIPDGSYYVYGVIDDGENSPVVDYSSGKVTINHNGAPAITITEPNGTGDNANQSFVIKWNATDPDDNAAISLFYDLNNFGQDGTLIVSGLSENSTTTQYTWNTAPLPAKDYFIYAIIDDGVNTPVTSYSTYVVKVRHNGGK